MTDKPVNEGAYTHRGGVQCATCGEELVPDDCPCGNPHGHGPLQPNPRAAQDWPGHPCFDPWADEND